MTFVWCFRFSTVRFLSRSIFSQWLSVLDSNQFRYRPISSLNHSFTNAPLQSDVQRLWRFALTPSTHNAYAAGIRVSHRFLAFNNLSRPIHRCTDERTLQYFIRHCFYILHIWTSSIRGYLSAVRLYCSSFGLPDPLRDSTGPFKLPLRTLLHATEKAQRNPRSLRLPIDSDILSRLCGLLSEGFFDPYWDCLLKATFCLAFFDFLRYGEFMARSLRAPAPISTGDLVLSSAYATLFLRRTKSDRSQSWCSDSLF